MLATNNFVSTGRSTVTDPLYLFRAPCLSPLVTMILFSVSTDLFFNKYVLSNYQVPGFLPDGNEKKAEIPALFGLTFHIRGFANCGPKIRTGLARFCTDYKPRMVVAF